MCDDFIGGGGDDSWDGPEWQDWMIIGPMSEQINRERKERDRIQRDNDESDDYWKIIGDPW